MSHVTPQRRFKSQIRKKREALIKEFREEFHDFLLAATAAGEGSTNSARNRAISLIKLERNVLKIINKNNTP